MFDVLVASGAHVELTPRWVSSSLVAHVLVLALAVVTTRAAMDAAPVTAPESVVLLFVPKPPPPSPPAAEAEPPRPVATVVAEPPAKGFQTIATLTDIPNVIPPVDLTQRPLDPRDFTGRGVEGGVAEGVVGGRVIDVSTPAVGELDAIYVAATRDERFEPAVVVFQPAPKYPKAVEALGVEGRVVVEFVIDTAGKVQPASIRIVESTHPVFEPATLEAVAKGLFRPARLSGHPVRQLSRQSVRFVAAR
jgi:TonB family protein